MPTQRLRAEQGVTIVEAAFVLPLLFLFALALVDIGLWEFQNSQASNAARDGARVGILRYKTAAGSTAAPGGADFQAINNAVKARLANQSYTVTVNCVSPTSEATIPGNCSSASIGFDSSATDRIKVRVTWSRAAMSPVGKLFGVTQSVTGTAVLQLVGLPQ
ncbi:MAG TPA: TadE/TadG family type IV pilus assembly protein [Acidimicrobiales bacterium]|jgi:Flp pilus assembly protein TadG|nr:TadE/TadG family type IV pilus assembly protein [Acidimicrobiales bacterium]